MPVKMECPHCNKALRVTEKAFGRTVPCPSCHQPISVSQPLFQTGHVAAPEFSGAAENGQATPDSATALPHGMPPVPENDGRSEPPDDPLAFLRSESAAASPSSQLPAGMPPIPQNSDESDLPMSASDLLARYRSTSKAKGFAIKEKLTRAVGVAKKRGLAMKLGHEARNLQTAIATQLETLGTLTLTHRPSAVSISDEIAELSRIQDGLSQKQSMLESLRQTKGSGPVVKELNNEVAQLLVCQKAVMVAVGRKTFGIRPDMAGAAGCYAALDRLHSSVEVKQGQVKAIEDEIGPVWRARGVSLGATKRPLLLVGAAAGGLLLATACDRCVARVRNAAAADRWIVPLAAGIAVAVILLFAVWFFAFTGGYQLDCKLDSDEYGNVWVDAAVKGKAAKVALVLVGPDGKSDVLVIEENEMITNSAKRRLPIEPEAGTYVVTLKTFTPERVVCARKVTLSPREFEVEVEDVSVGIIPCAGVDRDYLGKELDINGVKIFVRKSGTLPLRFKSVSLSADGQGLVASLSKPVVGAGRHVVEVAASTWGQRLILRRGARCVVEGQLFYGRDGKSSLTFRKEFVLPYPP